MELLKELWYTHMSEARTVKNKGSITLFSTVHKQHNNQTAAQNWLQLGMTNSPPCDANMNTDAKEM